VFALLLIGSAGGCSGDKVKHKEGKQAPESKAADKHEEVEKAPDMQGEKEPAGKPAQAQKAVERKIIYTATLRLEVENFGTAEEKLLELVEQNHGLLEKSDAKAQRGSSRSGHWKVRIPPEHLTAFRKSIAKLGEPEQNELNSREVTEEFYDLVEQIKSKEKELESYRRLYEQAKAVNDILAVKQGLDKSQEELDRMKGRHRLLQNLTSLTTVDIWMKERGTYTPEESPDFRTSAGRTFSDSLDALARFGRALALFAIALAPWLPVLLVVAVPLYLWWRHHRRMAALKSQPSQVPVLESAGPTGES
jgi:hypothetical protein